MLVEAVLLQRLQADAGRFLRLLLALRAALDLREPLALQRDHLVVQVPDQLLGRLPGNERHCVTRATIGDTEQSDVLLKNRTTINERIQADLYRKLTVCHSMQPSTIVR